MAYCLSCGKNRKTYSGMCARCRADKAERDKMDRMYARALAMRSVRLGRVRDAVE